MRNLHIIARPGGLFAPIFLAEKLKRISAAIPGADLRNLRNGCAPIAIGVALLCLRAKSRSEACNSPTRRDAPEKHICKFNFL